MNHKNTTLALAAIVAAVAVTGVAFAVPQQALAGGHHNHNNGNSVKVDQLINQNNFCNGTSTDCQNFGDNSADIHTR
jgi:hypothetical protein